MRDPVTRQILNADADAWSDHYRAQKLGVDVGFVPYAPRRLPIKEIFTKPHNTENFVLKTITFLEEVLTKPDGTIITPEARNIDYANKIAEHFAQGYLHGYAEDMVSAVQYLKWKEGMDSIDIFPTGFADLIKDQMVSQFMNEYDLTEDQIRQDPHCNECLSRINTVVSEREHSNVVGAARDTLDKYTRAITPFVAARYYTYPGNGKGALRKGQFVATPFMRDYIEQPMILARAKLWLILRVPV